MLLFIRLPEGWGATLLVRDDRKHVGNLLDTFLEWFLHHTLDERVQVSLDGEFHLAAFLGDRQKLNPEIEWNRTVLGFELDLFRFLAVDDSHLDFTYHRCLDGETVTVEGEVFNLVGRDFVLDALKIVQVAEILVNDFLTMRNLLNAAFECCHIE